MVFEDTFFEDEVRSGFLVSSEMKAAWAAQMEMLHFIDGVCRKHGLVWYAAGGTLLGAVRHKGYIPWDDDIDIWLFREDYDRLLSVLPAEIEDSMVIIHPAMEERYSAYFLRVVNSHGMRWDSRFLDRFHGCPYIVGVDIFPLDYLYREEADIEFQRSMVKMLYHIISVAGNGSINEEPEETKKLIRSMEAALNIKLDWDRYTVNELWRVCDGVYSLASRQDGGEKLTDWYLDYIEQAVQFDSKCVERVEYYPFENMMVPVPAGYDEILKAFYGDWKKEVREKNEQDYPFFKVQKKALVKMIEQEGGTLGEWLVEREREVGRKIRMKV